MFKPAALTLRGVFKCAASPCCTSVTQMHSRRSVQEHMIWLGVETSTLGSGSWLILQELSSCSNLLTKQSSWRVLGRRDLRREVQSRADWRPEACMHVLIGQWSILYGFWFSGWRQLSHIVYALCDRTPDHAEIYRTFLEIARTEGQKSQDKKRQLITKLLVSSQDKEAGYVMRALQVHPGIRVWGSS